MVPYVVQTGDIPKDLYTMFLEMRYVFERLPNFDFAEPVSCHVICRAFAENYPVECVDGHFSRGCDHSWLVLGRYSMQEHGKTGSIIADMYPCGGAAPFLVYGYFILPWEKLYIEDPSVIARRIDSPDFQEEVTMVATEVARLQREFAEDKMSI